MATLNVISIVSDEISEKNYPCKNKLIFEFLLIAKFKVWLCICEYGHAMGNGPAESYCDMHHGSSMGLYKSDVDSEYVKYVNPQEHGNHFGAKMLKIGKMCFTSENDFEFNVSKYSANTLYKAKHTDELVTDGKTHLRIDYKVSGVGSAACGPALLEKYQLNEKEITFRFSINI